MEKVRAEPALAAEKQLDENRLAIPSIGRTTKMEKDHHALDTGGGRDVKMGSDLGLERSQAQPKWEIPVYGIPCMDPIKTPYPPVAGSHNSSIDHGVIIPGVGWKQVAIGASEDSIRKILGAPAKTQLFNDCYFYDYPAHGIQVRFNRSTKCVDCLFFYNCDEGYEHFAVLESRSSRGIGWDSTPDDAIRVYGRSQEEYSGGRTHRIEFNGIGFRFLDGHLVRISIYPPTNLLSIAGLRYALVRLAQQTEILLGRFRKPSASNREEPLQEAALSEEPLPVVVEPTAAPTLANPVSSPLPDRIESWHIVAGLEAKIQAAALGFNQGKASPENFAAVLISPRYSPKSQKVNLRGKLVCNHCGCTSPFQHQTLLGVSFGSGSVRCPCGNRFHIDVEKESLGSGCWLIVNPEVVPARDSGPYVSLIIDKVWEEDEREVREPFAGMEDSLSEHTRGILAADKLREVSAVAFAPDGKRLLSADATSLLLWDVETGQILEQMAVHQDSLRWTAFTSDGTTAMSGGGNFNGKKEFCIRFWDLQTGHEIRRFDSPRKQISTMAASPTGSLAAFGEAYGQTCIRVYATETGCELQCLNEERNVLGLVFAHDGKRLLSATTRHTSFWDLEQGNLINRLSGTGEIFGLALNSDGTRAAFAGGDKLVGLWDLTSGREIRRFSGHTKTIYALAFSPNGRLLASAGGDKTVSVWDVELGTEAFRFDGHVDKITALAFAPDGRTLLSGSADRSLRLWSLAERD